MTVYPGFTVHTKEEFQKRLSEVEQIGDGLHIDIVDGIYAPNVTLPIQDMGKLPENRFCEAHLMVNNPTTYFLQCQEAGFKRVIVHANGLGLQTYAEMLVVQDKVHSLGMEFGLAFTHDALIELHEDLRKFDQITIMTVVPGFAGQPFIADELEELKKVKAFCPQSDIEVDGHVDDTTIDAVREAGATRIVSTSYLSGEDISIHYKKLKGE